MTDRASLTILVVDDEESMLKVAATILRRAGYQVLAARDAPEAITTLRENPSIALLFTDIKMPRIDGFMLADMAKVRRPDLKVLYATGFADEVSTRPGIRHGKILEKPYDPQQLREEVRFLLNP
jgi:CheY-like chemotaxis protein